MLTLLTPRPHSLSSSADPPPPPPPPPHILLLCLSLVPHRSPFQHFHFGLFIDCLFTLVRIILSPFFPHFLLNDYFFFRPSSLVSSVLYF
jgi:hypothetical protein